MNYRQALSYLDGFVNYERKSPLAGARPAFSLETMRDMSRALGEPWRRFDSLHIAGTKGKGSTCAFTAAMLRANGCRVGLYVSPHLQHVRERCSINGAWIPEADFARILSACVPVLDALRQSFPDRPPTYFEILTHVAFAWFAERQVDAAVIEVGLGGRLDATNIIQPLACAVCNISLDHTAILGATVALIAREKAGIFKPGVPIVSAPQSADVELVLRECAARIGMGSGTVTPIEFVGQSILCKQSEPNSVGADASTSTNAVEWPLPRAWASLPDGAEFNATLGLRGAHQIENWAVALRLADLFCRKKTGRGIPSSAVEKGAAETVWPGRLELFDEKGAPPLLLDGAHNAHSLEVVLQQVRQNLPRRAPLVCLFGCAKDKDSKGMLAALAREQSGADKLVLTDSCNPRGSEPHELLADWINISTREARVCIDAEQALALSKKLATHSGAVLVAGSLYLAGKIRSLVIASALHGE